MDFSLRPAEVDVALDGFRRVGDPLADAAVAELLEARVLRGPGGDLVGAVEAQAKAGGRACSDLLEQAFTAPSWVRFPQMRIGAQLGLRTPMQSALSLLLGSLLETYGTAKGAKVLIRAGMLRDHVARRLRDTSTFVLEVAASRGPLPGTFAHRHVLRTRLVHAFIRHGMLKRGDWDIAWGLPINQEDYAFTLMSFCHVYLRGLTRLGVAPTDEEEASLQHLYRWVGYVMGVAPELLTADRAEEERLYAHVRRRQLHPDADSRVLAKSLIEALAGRRPLFLPAPALAAIARRLLGDELGDQLALARSRPWDQLAQALPLLGSAQRRVERLSFTRVPLERAGERVARVLSERGFDPAP